MMIKLQNYSDIVYVIYGILKKYLFGQFEANAQ